MEPREPVDPDAPSALTVGRFVRVLARQWWVIPLCVVVAVSGAFAYARFAPRHYSSTVGVSLGTPPGSGAASSTAPPSLPDVSAEVNSASVVNAVARATHLAPGAVTLGISAQATDSSGSPIGNATITSVATNPLAAEVGAAAAGPAFVAQRSADLRGEISLQAAQLKQLQDRLNALQSGAPSTGDNGSTTFNPAGPSAAQIAVVNQLYQQLYGATVQLQVLASSVGQTHTVTAPTKLGLSTTRRAGEAAAAGLLIGLGLALARDSLRGKVTDPLEVRQVAGLPVLGRIPRLGRLLADGPVHPTLAEPFRAIRTATQLRSAGPQQVFLVLSAGRHEGRTLVAANLAASFARTGSPTVLVGTDLRHPDTAMLLGAEPHAEGLVEAVQTAVPEVDPARPWDKGNIGQLAGHLLHTTSISNLCALPAGRIVADSPELLGSEAFEKFVAALRQRFEYIILDSPALTEVSDALALTTYADGCVFVFTRNRSKKAEVAAAIEALALTPAKVLGTVHNMRGKPKRGRQVANSNA